MAPPRGPTGGGAGLPPMDDNYLKLLNSINEKMEALLEKQGQLASGSGAYQQLASSAQKYHDTQANIGSAVSKNTGLFDKFIKKVKQSATGTAIVNGLSKGFDNLRAVIKASIKVAEQFVDSVWEIGKALVAVPLGILQKFIDFAAAAPQNLDLARAIEDVREKFGDLKETTASTIVSVGRTMKGFSDTGLGLMQVFENQADMMRQSAEAAEGLGAQYKNLMADFKGVEGRVFAYQKGLGLSWEQMKAVENTSKSMGVSAADTFRDITKISKAMAKTFGYNAKEISKDMGKALQDVAHFGKLTVAEIGKAATYAKSLGLELDHITGIMDAFDTFEDAANATAMLSQAFGTQIDMMDVFNASDATEQLNILRKSFKSAGVSAENMDRHQLKVLASTLHLSEADAKLAFSMNNQGKSLEELKKAGDKAAKSTMTQEEAMHELSNSIKRLNRDMPTLAGSFFGMFTDGLGVGIQQSKEFKDAIMAIRGSLQVVYRAGIEFGKMIMEKFPGIKTMLQGITDLFNAGKITKFFTDVKNSFSKFFDSMKDGKGSVPELMDHIKDAFVNLFDASTPGGKKFLDGLKQGLKTIVTLIGGGIKWAIQELANGFKFMTRIISGQEEIPGAGVASGTSNFIVDIFNTLKKSLSGSLDLIVNQLGPNMWEFAEKLFKKIVESVRESFDKHPDMWKSILGGLATIFAAPSLIAGIGSLFTGALTQGLQKGGKSTDTSGLQGALTMITGQAATPEVPKQNSGDMIGAVIPGKDTLDKADEAISRKIDWKGIGILIGEITALIGVAVVGLFKAMETMKDKSWDEIGKGIAGLAVVGAIMYGLSKALEGLSTMGPGSTIGGIIVAAGATAAWLVSQFVTADPKKGLSGVIANLADVLKNNVVPAISALLNAGNNLSGSAAEVASKMSAIASLTTSVLEFITKFVFMLKDIDEATITKIGTGLTKVGDALKDHFMPAISSMLTGIISAAAQIADPEKTLLASKVVTGLMEMTLSLLKTMVDLMQKEAAPSVEEANQCSSQLIQSSEAAGPLAKAFQEVAVGIPMLVNSIKDVIQKLPTDNAFGMKLKRMGEVIGIITSINSVMSDVMKSPAAKEGIVSGGAAGPLMQNIDGITTFLGNLAAGGEESPIAKMLSSIGAIGSVLNKTKVNTKSVFDSLSIIFSSISNGTEEMKKAFSVGGEKIDNIALVGGPGNEVGLYGLRVLLSRLTDDFGGNPLESMLGSVTTIGATISGKAKNVQTVAKELAAIFKSVGEFVTISKESFADSGTKKDVIMQGVNDSVSLLQNLQEKVPSLTTNVTTLSPLVTTLNGAKLPSLDPFASQMTAFGKSVDKVATSLKKNGIEAVLDNLSSVIKSSQELDTALGKGFNFDLPAKLTKVASGLGLNKKFDFKYNQEQIVIKINLDVSMDAAKVEAGILRHGVEIRQRLNQALDDRIKDNSNRYIPKDKLITNEAGVPDDSTVAYAEDAAK